MREEHVDDEDSRGIIDLLLEIFGIAESDRSSAPGEPGTLQVQAPIHTGIHFVGVLLRKVERVHVRNSSGVVVGDHCTLTNTDHYHIEYVTLDSESLTQELERNEDLRVALRALTENPRDPTAVGRFQNILLAHIAPDLAPDTTELPIDEDTRTLIMRSRNIQRAENTKMNLERKYVIDETRLSLADMLAVDDQLTTAFAKYLTNPGSPAFDQELLNVAAASDDLDLLRGAIGVDWKPNTTLRGHRNGTMNVIGAVSGVMIGSDNRLLHQLEVHHPDLTIGDLPSLGKAIRRIANIPEPIPESPAPPFDPPPPVLPSPAPRSPRQGIHGPGFSFGP